MILVLKIFLSHAFSHDYVSVLNYTFTCRLKNGLIKRSQERKGDKNEIHGCRLYQGRS